MKYQFDTIIDRHNSLSTKYAFQSHGRPEDTLPLWVADMDFVSPIEVQQALEKTVKHGIYGYSEPDEEYVQILKNWFLRRHNWEIDSKWLLTSPGIVSALKTAIHAYTKPGDSVLIQQPVYHPFAISTNLTGRNLVVNELVLQDGVYQIDFDDFEQKIKENHVKLFLLCNPHNPVGRVWSKEELIKMGEICYQNQVFVVSDEIHQDFIYCGHQHVVFANLSEKFREISITCTAPTKTFNLAGLQISNIFIPNSQRRQEFRDAYLENGLVEPNLMGLVACKAAYQHGEDWLEQVLEYLAGNFQFLDDFLQKNIPQVKLIQPQGTYLAWVDFRGVGLSTQEINHRIIDQAHLWFNDGAIFGAGGEGFQRINLACPRPILEQTLIQLKEVFS